MNAPGRSATSCDSRHALRPLDHSSHDGAQRPECGLELEQRPPDGQPGKLAQDPSITWVVNLSAPVALAALQATQAAGSQAKIVTFDLNSDVAKAVQDGQIVFSIDQQPYVQGYMAVQALWLNLTNGNDIGGGKPVLTGPSFVDSSNIEKIATYAANNTR